MANIAGWIVALITVMAFMFERWERAKDNGDKAADARLKPVHDEIGKAALIQSAIATKVEELSQSQVRLEQRVSDHESRDEQRFNDITGAFWTMDRKIDELPQKIKDLLGK